MMRRNSNRRGSVLVCIIACMIVVTAIAATSIQATLRTRRETKIDLQVIQAELLCQAGILRARRQAESNKDYRGEQWTPSMADEKLQATIDIVVSLENDRTKEINVNASLRAEDSQLPMIRRSYQFQIKRQQIDR